MHNNYRDLFKFKNIDISSNSVTERAVPIPGCLGDKVLVVVLDEIKE